MAAATLVMGCTSQVRIRITKDYILFMLPHGTARCEEVAPTLAYVQYLADLGLALKL